MNDTKPKAKLSDRIIRAGTAVFIAHICLKVVGLLQFFIVGGIVETKTWETVYGFAFDGVIFSLFFIGEEMIGPSFLPIFSSEREKSSDSAAWTVANTLLSCQFIILGLLVLLLMLYPSQITNLLTYWKSNDQEAFSLASTSVRYMAPALLCYSLGSTTYMLLNGYKKFFLAAFADAVWKFCVLGCTVVGMGILGLSWKALAFGIIAGSIAKLATHLIGLRKVLYQFKPAFLLKNPAFKAMLWLMLPLLVGIIFAKVRDFYNHITVLSALETDGLIKANAYGRKLFQTIGMIVPYTLSIAMFPYFCDLVNRKDSKQLAAILTKSARMLLVIFIPAALVFTVYSHSLTQLLVFGKYSSRDAVLSGLSMAAYTLVLPAYGLEMLLMQAFFAKRKMISVTIIGIIFSSLSIAISYFGIIHFGLTAGNALLTVAGGFTLSRTLKALTLTFLLKRTIPIFPARETGLFLGKTLLTGLISTLTVWLCFQLFGQLCSGEAKYLIILKLLLGFGAAAISFLIAVYIFKLNELFDMLYWLKQKLNRQKTGTTDA